MNWDHAYPGRLGRPSGATRRKDSSASASYLGSARIMVCGGDSERHKVAKRCQLGASSQHRQQTTSRTLVNTKKSFAESARFS